MQNLFKVRTQDQRLIPLQFNRTQREIDRFLSENPGARPLILKGRRQGVSSFFLLSLLDDCIFTENCVAGVLSHSQESLSYLVQILRVALDSMPRFIKPRTDEDSTRAISFPDSRSRIFVSLAIRSVGVSRLHLSELAFCDPVEVEASLAAAGTQALVSAETTPDGMNHFYDLWQEAKTGNGPWTPLFFPWMFDETCTLPLNGLNITRTIEEANLAKTALEKYGLTLTDEQILWRRSKKKELKRLFDQEFPSDDSTCFLTSGTRFFDALKIQALLSEALEDQENKPIAEESDLIQWERPQPRHIYVAGADPANAGNDYSVLAVICTTCRKTAFRYRARVGIESFYKTCDRWGRAYNCALLAVENNAIGAGVLLGLSEGTRYPSIYKDDVRTRLSVNGSSVQKLGWATTAQSRPILLGNLKTALEGDELDDVGHFSPEILWLDQELMKECLAFETKEGRYEAASGHHDDVIFAWGLALQVYQHLRRRNAPFKTESWLVGPPMDAHSLYRGIDGFPGALGL